MNTFRIALAHMLPEIEQCSNDDLMHGFIDIARLINATISDRDLREINYMHQAGAFDG